jgi:hypothetical protein
VRAIFLRELQAGLVPDVIICLLALAAFTAVERALMGGGTPSEDARQGIDLVLFGCAALLSFASGARTFPREIKERRLLSLYILPISRGTLWCALVGGRLIACTAALATLFLARRSILLTLVQMEPLLGSLVLLVALIPVLFMAGVCSSLTFENNATVYLIGYPLAFFSVFQIIGLAKAGFSSWRPTGLVDWFWTLSLALLFFVLSALSWWFFRLGDLTVRRRSLAKQVHLTLALLCTFGVTGAATHSTLLANRLGPWVQDQVAHGHPWERDQQRAASPGGRYLAIAERLAGRPGLSRLNIVETSSGRVITTQMWHDLLWARWSAHEQELYLLLRDHWAPEPWRTLLAPQRTWVRLSPEGKELSRFPLGSIPISAFLPDGTDLIINDTGDKIQLLDLKNRPVPSVIQEIPRIPQLWPVHLYRNSQGVIVFDTLGSRWWVKNGKVHRIDSSDDRYFGRPAEIDLYWQDDPALSLWTRTSTNPKPKRRATGLAPTAIPEEARLLNEFLIRSDQRPSISRPESLAIYLPTGGRDGIVSLYDGVLDREIPLPVCTGGRAVFPELIAAESGPAFMIRFQCHVPARAGNTVRARHFYYLPGSGAVKPLPVLDRIMAHRPLLLAYLDERSAIWLSEDNRTWTLLRNGQLRTLWPHPHASKR